MRGWARAEKATQLYGDDVSLFVGGRSADKYRFDTDLIQAPVIPDLPVIPNELERIRSTSNYLLFRLLQNRCVVHELTHFPNGIHNWKGSPANDDTFQRKSKRIFSPWQHVQGI